VCLFDGVDACVFYKLGQSIKKTKGGAYTLQ
jgi:hypothetical protein